MHPLVRDLYKRALLVGRDYPLGLEYVRRTWKKALRNPYNCPSCYVMMDDGIVVPDLSSSSSSSSSPKCERELRKAVGRGRFMVREMIGVIQIKKYRTLKKLYDDKEATDIKDLLAMYLGKKPNP
jgi:hypothetical protein